MKSFIVSIILLMSACISIPDADSKSIRVNASVGSKNVKVWDSLSADQKKQSYWKLVRSIHDLNWSLNEVAIPDEFKNDPWAVKTSVAEVSSSR